MKIRLIIIKMNQIKKKVINDIDLKNNNENKNQKDNKILVINIPNKKKRRKFNREEKEDPNINSKTTKKLQKYDVINYEGVIENQFGKWIFFKDEYRGIAEDKKSSKYVQHPVIEDGIYIILPFGKKKAFTSNNSIISLQDISLNDNLKFLFRFNPEKRNYRINCLSPGKELTIDSNSGIIKECDSGEGIRWLIDTLNYREFSLKDNQTKKLIKFIKNEEIALLNSGNYE